MRRHEIQRLVDSTLDATFFADGAGVVVACNRHIFRDIDLRKRLELLMRDFIAASTPLSADQLRRLVASTRAPARSVDLALLGATAMRQLAQGTPTGGIAKRLHIGPTTVRNHGQHAMRALGAHTPLEGLRRAERAGLV